MMGLNREDLIVLHEVARAQVITLELAKNHEDVNTSTAEVAIEAIKAIMAKVENVLFPEVQGTVQ